MNHITVI